MSAILFHIGYHKTGTTWMQRQLFQPAHGYKPVLDHDEVFSLITRPHRLAFDPDPVRAQLNARITDDAVPVVSSEILSGHPFWGGRDSADFAERIAAIVPKARILITIRAQIPAIASVYMQYVRRGGRLSAQRFFSGTQVIGYDGFDPVHFEYHRLVAHYQSIFGVDRVKILTQEQLAKDPKAFVTDLAAFAKVGDRSLPSFAREGVSEAEIAVPLLRRINHLQRDGAGPDPIVDLGGMSALLYKGIGWLSRRDITKRLSGGRRPVTALADNLFGGQFKPSNAQLLDMVPDLTLPGYEV